jgi:hypothetical protein
MTYSYFIFGNLFSIKIHKLWGADIEGECLDTAWLLLAFSGSFDSFSLLRHSISLRMTDAEKGRVS